MKLVQKCVLMGKSPICIIFEICHLRYQATLVNISLLSNTYLISHLKTNWRIKGFLSFVKRWVTWNSNFSLCCPYLKMRLPTRNQCHVHFCVVSLVIRLGLWKKNQYSCRISLLRPVRVRISLTVEEFVYLGEDSGPKEKLNTSLVFNVKTTHA